LLVTSNIMITQRTKDTYEKQIYDFIKDIDIVCPSCLKKAIVKSDSSLSLFHNIDKNLVRIICTNCGYSKLHTEIPKGEAIIQRTFIIGGAIDPYFHQPLWLKIKYGENTLWAYNYEHLEFLEKHVEAKLRERNIESIKNNSLGSRLPKWITSKKNRELVLKTIKQLKDK
jgi:predicted nucleic-acid-binding Zn-ribbon protein